MGAELIESTLIIGLNVEFNVDAVSDIPRAILPSDLLSRDQDTLPAFAEPYSVPESTDDGQTVMTELMVEIWNALGCSPVLVLRLISHDFTLPSVGSTPKNISLDEYQSHVTAILDDANISVDGRSIESLFNKDLPFVFRNDDDTSRPKNLSESEIDKHLVAPSDSHGSSNIAALAFSGDPEATFDMRMAAVVLVGIQSQRTRLNRMAAIWMNGSSTSDDEGTDAWRRQGTRLLQESGLMAMSTRTLAQNTTHLAESAGEELQLSSDLIRDIGDLVPAIQHSTYQDRMQSLEDLKLQKRQEAEDAEAKSKKDAFEKAEADNLAVKLREAEEATRRKLVGVGSVAVFAVTAISLVPAIASVDRTFIRESWFWFDAWNAWLQTLIVLVIVGAGANIGVEWAFAEAGTKWRTIFWDGIRVKWFRKFNNGKNSAPAVTETADEVTGERSLQESPKSDVVPNSNGLPNAADEVGRAQASTSPAEDVLDVPKPVQEAPSAYESDVNIEYANPRKLSDVPDTSDGSDNHTDHLMTPVEEKVSVVDSTVYRIRTRAGMRADAVKLENGKVRVLGGARARAEALPSTTEPNLELRDKLKAERILKQDENAAELLILTADQEFMSFAQAAGVILGRSTTGPREWDEVATEDEVVPESFESTPPEEMANPDIFRLKSGNSLVSAKATYNFMTKRMTVHKGSTLRIKMTDSFQITYREERRRLEETGYLKLSDDGSYYILLRDCDFNSPSMAASVLLGRSSSGNASWEQLGTNTSLGEVLVARQADEGMTEQVSNLDSPIPESGITDKIWELSGAGDVRATGIYLENNKFQVIAGSRARLDQKQSTSRSNSGLRKELIQKAVLTDQGTHYELVSDYVFDSPSQAAGVFLGRSANGLTEWTIKGAPLGEFLEDVG